MGSLFGWVLAIMLVIWAAWLFRITVREHKLGEPGAWAVWTCGFLIVLGGLGFFGSMLLAVGMIRLPASLEWPAGYVDGVVDTADGKHIVPLPWVGRVQIYSRDWRYMTGWHVDAGGGQFKVVSWEPNTIEVFTSRGRHHDVYDEAGLLLKSEKQKGDDWPGGKGRSVIVSSVVVPTFPLLWPFTDRLLCLGLLIVGGVLLIIALARIP